MNELVNQKYFIEPSIYKNGWVLRKEGNNSVLKKAKFKTMLVCLAENILTKQKAELRICDSNGMLEDIIYFGQIS